MAEFAYTPMMGLMTTARDRVRAKHPDATAKPAAKTPGLYVIVTGGSRRLGRGANPARAWEDAARQLPRT